MENRIFQDEEGLRFVAKVGNDVAPGTPLIIQGKPVVTFTGSGDYAKTRAIVAGNTSISVTTVGGGIGLLDDQATVTPTGTYTFPVAGSSITAAYDADGNGKTVYIEADGDLTLTEAGNTPFGVVAFFRGTESATDTAVRIGVTL